MELSALPSGPALARRFVKAALKAWHAQSKMVDTAELLVSELVTNAIRTCRPADDADAAECISLTLRHQPGHVVIEVGDHDPRPPALTDAGTDAEEGRGLLLVQALSKEWGHHYPPSGGKTVFCVLSADS
jgi:anti-sigma regulatory factor (Ser/Thr protein kinase)